MTLSPKHARLFALLFATSSLFTLLYATPAGAVPAVALINPLAGPPGTIITITGSGFAGASDVRFGTTAAGAGGVSAAWFSVESDSAIHAAVPQSNPNGNLTVTTPTGSAVSTQKYTRSIAKFSNPLVHSASMSDVQMTKWNGFYYFVMANGSEIWVWKSATLTGIDSAEKRLVWTLPGCTSTCPGDAMWPWQPEIHQLVDPLGVARWYIYYAPTDGINEPLNHRIYVLEGGNDPLGSYVSKGSVQGDVNSNTAIDPTIMWANGSCTGSPAGPYLVWSGSHVPSTDGYSRIYVERLATPWSVTGGRVQLSVGDQPWEQSTGEPVNEGPQIATHGSSMHILYNASGVWDQNYKVGRLTNTNGCLLNAASWTKVGPVFQKDPTKSVYATGSVSVVSSPDDAESWLIYQAVQNGVLPEQNKTIRAQRFTWNSDNTPALGTPVALTAAQTVPGGEQEGTGWGASSSGQLQEGDWTVADASSVTSPNTGFGWHQIFRRDTVNDSPAVTVTVDWLETGTDPTVSSRRAGVFSYFVDGNNWVGAWLNKTAGTLETTARVGGVWQPWTSTLLTGINLAAPHTLHAVKTGQTHAFFVDFGSTPLQVRTFNISGPGNVGLTTEDTRAKFTNLVVEPSTAPFGWSSIPTGSTIGNWSLPDIDHAQIEPQGFAPWPQILRGGPLLLNYTVESSFQWQSEVGLFAPQFGLLAFYRDWSNYVTVGMDHVNNELVISWSNAGTSGVARTPIAGVNWSVTHSLKAVKKEITGGSRFDAYFDGIKKATITISFISDAYGTVGLYSNNASVSFGAGATVPALRLS